VTLVAAGGIADGRGVAAALMLGASGVWVGTRFIPAKESKYPESAKQQVIDATYDSWIKSTIWSGRPLRAHRNWYIDDWEQNRQAEIKELQSKGKVPLEYELDRLHKEGKLTDEIEEAAALRYGSRLLRRMSIYISDFNYRPIGIVAGSVNTPNMSAKEIVEEMVRDAAKLLGGASGFLTSSAKL